MSGADEISIQLDANEWSDGVEENLRVRVEEMEAAARRAHKFFVGLTVLRLAISIPAMLLAYVFGSSGLALTFDDSTADAKFLRIQSYVMLAVGACHTFLDRVPLHLHAHRHQRVRDLHRRGSQKIKDQLAAPRHQRRSVAQVMSYVEKKTKQVAAVQL